MADDPVEFKLDLDIAEFTEKGLKAKGLIQGIGSSENLTELIEGLTKTTAILGTVGVALFAVKEAFDLTLEGEQIQRINDQFDILTAQAGISGEELKKGLEEASHGLIDTESLLQIANKSIVAMGDSAKRLPEVMELATKAAQITGMDTKSAFEAITQAVETGNLRMLKNMGIVIDTNKAYKDFAASQGLATNELSRAGQQQALLNAVLEKGGEALSGVNVDLKSATNTWETLKTTVKELGEVFVLAFEKTIGPTVRSFLTSIKNMASSAKEHLKSLMGVQEESHQKQLENIHQVAQESKVDQEKRLQNEIKFQKELQAIDKETFKLKQEHVTEFSQIESLIQEQKLMDERMHQQKLDEIKSQYATQERLKDKLIAAERTRYTQQAGQQEQQLNQLRIKLLDNYKTHSETAFKGIGRSFQVMAMKARADWTNFGKRGDEVVQSFQTYSTAAFEQIGESIAKGTNVAEAAANAMKGFFLNMLADRAIGEGQMLLLSGIWPPNPVALAAGAGLITLGGALRSLVGGTGTTVGGATGGGVGTSGIGVATSPAPETGAQSGVEPASSNESVSNMSGMQNEQRTVHVNIAGNYFDTDTTRKQLMEMIRSETDATDFQYNRIGV